MTEAELTLWASAHPNMPQAVAVLAMLAERDRLRLLVDRLAERCAAQAALLAKRAERPDVIPMPRPGRGPDDAA